MHFNFFSHFFFLSQFHFSILSSTFFPLCLFSILKRDILMIFSSERPLSFCLSHAHTLSVLSPTASLLIFEVKCPMGDSSAFNFGCLPRLRALQQQQQQQQRTRLQDCPKLNLVRPGSLSKSLYLSAPSR